MSKTSSPTTTSASPELGVNAFRPFTSLVRIDVSALSHPGMLRENNEDQFFVTKMSRALETLLTSLPSGDVPERAEEVNYVLIVADGMGGHAAGEVASRLAISALVQPRARSPDWIFKLDWRPSGRSGAPGARGSSSRSGRMLYERGRE